MRHLEKIENFTLKELSEKFDQKFDTKVSSSMDEHIYQGKLHINLRAKTGIQDLAGGMKIQFPAKIEIRNYKDYVVLEINLNITKIIFISVIFAAIISLLFSFQTPLKFSAISGVVIGIATYAFLYFKAEKGLEHYGNDISKLRA